ncbi:MAG: rhodanese-like domain-containing protein [Limisphaerales bacterium]
MGLPEAMSGSPRPSAPRNAGSAAVGLLAESALVLIAGLAFALLANRISPGGLKLGGDYFPKAVKTVPPFAPGPSPVPVTSAINSGVASNAVVARLQEKGLHAIELSQVAQLYRDPRYPQELVIFVDARDDANYRAGHIPGAYQLDQYHPENYLPTVLPPCQNAEKIVVYCHGGDCEDSEFAAVTLNQAGVPAARLFVYTGGFSEWSSNGLAVEIGARLSGNLRAPKP